ncbi:MAG: hypothetical protein ACRD0K_21910, partial [Egibacteraceae bacterium]
PYSERVEQMSSAVVVFTPCCGARVFFTPEEAASATALEAICPRNGQLWRLEFIADETVDGGLRPVWAAFEDRGHT